MFPGVQIHSNDVSLLSVAIGRYLVGEPLGFRFKGEMEFLEECCTDDEARLSALFCSTKIAKVISKRNQFFAMRFETYVQAKAQMVEAGRDKVRALMSSIKISTFAARDWLAHATECSDKEGVLIGFPPTYKGGYEKLYKAIDANVEWESPNYEVFDPGSLAGLLDSFKTDQATYLIGTDQRFDDRDDMVSVVGNSGKKHIYLYHGRQVPERAAGLIGKRLKIRWRYEPVKIESVSQSSRVTVALVKPDIERAFACHYLSTMKDDAKGSQVCFAVSLDGKLVGFFCFNDSNLFESAQAFLYRDYSLVPNSRLSKLIIMLAKSERAVRIADRALLQRDSDKVFTAVFSRHPVSMKYRGVFDKTESKPLGSGGYHLRYESDIDPRGPEEIYQDWFRRYFANQQPKS